MRRENRRKFFSKVDFKYMPIVILLLVGGLVLILELLSRRKCASVYESNVSCFDLIDKYYKEVNLGLAFDIYNKLAEVKEPSKISDEDIERIIELKTKAIPQSDIKGLNGIFCGIYNFVSDELPPRASRFVKIHEAIHYLGVKNETKTNYLAARKEPLGFVQTIVYSIVEGLDGVKLMNLHCHLGRAWNLFKMYFLDFKIKRF